MNYSIEKIKGDYKKYIKHYNPKNFLINYFNLPDNSKSGLIIYLLEGKTIPKCQICNKNAKFINYEKGFRITCGNKKCQNEFVKNKFKNKPKEEKIIKKCEFCGKNFKSKTPTRKYCDTCKNDIFKCLECNIVKHKNERCKELSHISICKNYSENLFLNIIGLNNTLKTIYKKFYSKKYTFGNENIFIKYRKDNSKGGNIYLYWL